MSALCSQGFDQSGAKVQVTSPKLSQNGIELKDGMVGKQVFNHTAIPAQILT